MTSFNIHQQVFGLSLAANITRGLEGTQSDIQKKTSAALQPIIDAVKIGNWKVVWGPNVWKAEPASEVGTADHTWYIAHNPSAVFEDGKSYDTYVVAIAATTPKSLVDFTENIDVGIVVDFNRWLELGLTTLPLIADDIDATKPYIAFGAASGVHRLLNLPTSDGITLSRFLSTIPATSRILFTGHSLGGVLSPTVALAVVKAGSIQAPPSSVLTYPTAGASPGNGPFANLYASTFPRIGGGDVGYKAWNCLIWNTYDIAPCAWAIGKVGQDRCLSNIPAVYGELPPTLNTEVSGVVDIVEELLVSSGAPAYVPLQGSQITPLDAPVTPQNLDEFLATVGDQHIVEYIKVIGTPDIPPIFKASGLDEAANQIPLIGLLGKVKKNKGAEEGSKGKVNV